MTFIPVGAKPSYPCSICGTLVFYFDECERCGVRLCTRHLIYTSCMDLVCLRCVTPAELEKWNRRQPPPWEVDGLRPPPRRAPLGQRICDHVVGFLTGAIRRGASAARRRGGGGPTP